MIRRRYIFVLLGILISILSSHAQNDQANHLKYLHKFDNSKCFTVTPGGIVYVYDQGNHSLIKLSSTGDSLAAIGGFGWDKNSFAEPVDLSAPNDLDLYLADNANNRIIQYDRMLTDVANWKSAESDNREKINFRYPKSIAVDNFGELYILDGENKRILKISRHQKVERTFGGFDAGKGRLANPKKIRIDNSGEIYVQDGDYLVVFDLFGNYIRTIGTELFHSVKTFCISSDYLAVVDSIGISKVNREGKILSHMEMTDIDKLFKHHNLIDINYRNGVFFILTEKYLFSVRSEILFK